MKAGEFSEMGVPEANEENTSQEMLSLMEEELQLIYDLPRATHDEHPYSAGDLNYGSS